MCDHLNVSPRAPRHTMCQKQRAAIRTPSQRGTVNVGDVGDTICVQDDGTWYDAELVAKHLDGRTYDVKYVDNGVTEQDVPLSRLGVMNPIIMSKVIVGDTIR